MHTTSESLLDRLRQQDPQEAWVRFVQLYTPLLTEWAHRLRLQPQDASDLVQEVFAVLVQEMPEFRYDPNKRFRGWLWTVTVNKWRDRCRQRAARMQFGQDSFSEPAVPDAAEAVSETEYRQYLTRRALEFMQAEFQPASWRAFWECVVHERPAREVARELGISENAVYLSKSRVLRRLRRELDGLLD